MNSITLYESMQGIGREIAIRKLRLHGYYSNIYYAHKIKSPEALVKAAKHGVQLIREIKKLEAIREDIKTILK